MVEDLLFVRAVLDAARIKYLLVRGNDERPVIAIELAAREALTTALVHACRAEPFYSKTVDARGKAVLVADGSLSPSANARIVRLYRPGSSRSAVCTTARPRRCRSNCGRSPRPRSCCRSRIR